MPTFDELAGVASQDGPAPSFHELAGVAHKPYEMHLQGGEQVKALQRKLAPTVDAIHKGIGHAAKTLVDAVDTVTFPLTAVAQFPQRLGSSQIAHPGDIGKSLYAGFHPSEQDRYDREGLAAEAKSTGMPQLALESGNDLATKARNFARVQAYETTSDIGMIVPGWDGMTLALRGIHGAAAAAKAAQVVEKAAKLAEKVPGGAKAADKIKATAEAVKTGAAGNLDPRVDHELAKTVTKPTKEIVQGSEIRGFTRDQLDLKRQIAVVEKHRPALAAEEQRMAAERAGNTFHHKDLNVRLPDDVRHELLRDAYLNGTQEVRDKAHAMLGKLGRPPSPEDRAAPLLDLQTDIREHYEPKQHLSYQKSLEQPEWGDKVRGLMDKPGFNYRQQKFMPKDALADRIIDRLKTGARVRQEAQKGGLVLDDLGLKAPLKTTAFAQAALDRAARNLQRAIRTGDQTQIAQANVRVAALQKRIGKTQEHLRTNDRIVQDMLSEYGAAQRAEPVRPPSWQKPEGHVDAEVARVARHMGLDPAAVMTAKATVERETGEIMLPSTIAARLIDGPSLRLGHQFLQGLSDLRRNAIFMIAATHMKNIGELQAQGPGGMDALSHGAAMYADRVVDLAQTDFSRKARKLAADTAKAATAEEWEDMAHRLVERGAHVEYADAINPFSGNSIMGLPLTRTPARMLRAFYGNQNEHLWNWDTAQRGALDHHLLQNEPGYQELERVANGDDHLKAQQAKYQQGAIINATLFNYYHQSPLAQTLRMFGSDFPHWRIGNATTQIKHLTGTGPGGIAGVRRSIAIARTEQILNRTVFPDDGSKNAAGLSMNLPLDEGMKSFEHPKKWMLGTFTPMGDLDRTKDLLQTLTGGLAPAVESLGGRYVGGVSQLEQATGTTGFPAAASEGATAAAGLFGANFQKYPSAWAKREREQQAEHPGLTFYELSKRKPQHGSF